MVLPTFGVICMGKSCHVGITCESTVHHEVIMTKPLLIFAVSWSCSKALLFYFKRADQRKMRGIEQIPAAFVLFE